MKFVLDPSEEFTNVILPGVQHKYDQTVLILTTNKCFQYCKHCFRKRNFNEDKEICKNSGYEKVFEYLNNHEEVSNVLLSGGDPLTLSKEKLKYIVENIPKNIQIRIGTRALTFKPEVFIPVINILKSRDVQIISHINTANELQNSSSVAAIQLLRNNGINIRSQTVLLNGVNNQVQILIDLYRFITKIGIFPYYLFQCRPVVGNKRFIVPIIDGLNLIKKSRQNLSGLEKSFRFIISSRLGKIEVLNFDEESNLLTYRFHQNREVNLIDEIFHINIEKNETWIDQIEN